MLDGVSLDQLRTFIAAVDEGSFSAAGRRLGRAQSVVSQTMANLESQLGVRLFERGGRLPVLTAAGKALLTDARTVAHSMDLFKARARGLAGGLEPEVSIVVDVMFPTEVLTSAVAAFHAEFPNTPLRISVDGLGAVIEPVLDGRCAFGIRGTLPISPPELSTEHLLVIGYQWVASPEPSPRGQARADSERRALRPRPVGAQRPLEPVRRQGPGRVLATDVAAVRPRRQARLPSGGLRLGRHAAPRRRDGSGNRVARPPDDRGHGRGHQDADVGNLPNGFPTRSSSPMADRPADIHRRTDVQRRGRMSPRGDPQAEITGRRYPPSVPEAE